MDTQKTITVGALGYQYDVVSERHGRYITLSLTTNGNLVVSLTPEGVEELAERLQAREDALAVNDKYIPTDEDILGEMCEDLQGNGIGYTPSLDAWGHMTGSAGFSDDYTVEDDNTVVADRVWWMPDYERYPTTLERLQTGKLVFEWSGKRVYDMPDMPSPMHLW